MTDSDLSDIERRCEAATAGPWRALRDEMDYWHVYALREQFDQSVAVCGDNSNRVLNRWAGDNAAFLASCRTDIPKLIAALRESRADEDSTTNLLFARRAENDSLRAQLEAAQGVVEQARFLRQLGRVHDDTDALGARLAAFDTARKEEK